MSKKEEKCSANEWYEFARRDFEKKNWGLAASQLWMALSLGHTGAPYSLSTCFEEGRGVDKNEYIAKLMFGVALGLGDPKCEPHKHKVQIPSTMNGAIKSLTQLIRATQATIPNDKEVDMGVVIEQMNKFDQAIHLPNSQSIYKLFISPEQNNLTTTGHYHKEDHTKVHYEERETLLGNNHHNDDDCCCTLF